MHLIQREGGGGKIWKLAVLTDFIMNLVLEKNRFFVKIFMKIFNESHQQGVGVQHKLQWIFYQPRCADFL